MIGISIKKTIGVGDALQFSSLPENYFRATGRQLFDVSQPWFFDYNPYVVRDRDGGHVQANIHKIVEMWNFSPHQWDWPYPRGMDKPQVYLSNAEIWARALGVPAVMTRPRLYKYEMYPFQSRRAVLLHTSGQSHGEMPSHVIEHVKEKYGAGCLIHVGTAEQLDANKYGIAQLSTPTLWDFAELVSSARLFIGMDSGPSWIAACYPDVVVKKLRVKPNPPDLFSDWVPLEIRNIHSHWDDRAHQVHNVTEDDIGFTYSYKRL